MSNPLTAQDRETLILEYEQGAGLLRSAWESVPEEAEKWKPAPDKWSAHEVVIHCADSETYSATRLRLLVAEKDPVIVGYDQAAWADIFRYHSQSTDRALRTVDAVRVGTLVVLRALSESDWTKMGRHTESGPYGVADWLRSYAAHLTGHANQIQRTVEAYHRAAR